MDVGLELLLMGLSHRTASVEERELCSVPAETLAERLAEIRANPAIEECFLLSTCNRTELLAATREAREGELERAFRGGLFERARASSLYVHHGVHAVIHLFRVAGGLDSLVLGESQILAQVRESARVAREAGTLGRTLEPLLQQALAVGKRVRSETKVGEGSLSVARVGVEVARRVFGRFSGRSALIVGAGETALLVAKHLKEAGLTELVFASRRAERAEAAAREHGGRAEPLASLPELVRRADIVLPCVEGARGLVTRACFDARAIARRDQPLLVIDLSVPRAVEAPATELENLLYYDLDDLAAVVEKNREERERATEGSDEILVAEVHKFVALRTYAAFSPVIEDLRRDFREVREAVEAELTGSPPQLASELGHRLAAELERRLLDAALRRLKEGARHAQPAEVLSRAYQRFKEGL